MLDRDKLPPSDGGIDFEDVELAERYARSGATPALHERDAASNWDPELKDKLEREWFEMGDQESWMEVRPRVERAGQMPRKP